MSVQLVAPHSVAISAMNNISLRSCSALSARGSGNSEKHSANRCIGCSLHISSYPQNPFLPIWQLLAAAHMRFPCPPGEGAAKPHNSALSRHILPESCKFIRPKKERAQATLKKRGRREDRVRAAPAVSRARVDQKTHTSIQVQRKHSGLPCAMVLQLIPCSPR
jgi:hypothetical protein